MTITTKWGNYMDKGYFQVSNILIDFQDELGLTDTELLFILKISRHKEDFKLHDAKIDKNVSDEALRLRRRGLEKKGYLKCQVSKTQDHDGSWRTDGVVYDLSGLGLALQNIADRVEKKEAEKRNQPNPSLAGNNTGQTWLQNNTNSSRSSRLTPTEQKLVNVWNTIVPIYNRTTANSMPRMYEFDEDREYKWFAKYKRDLSVIEEALPLVEKAIENMNDVPSGICLSLFLSVKRRENDLLAAAEIWRNKRQDYLEEYGLCVYPNNYR